MALEIITGLSFINNIMAEDIIIRRYEPGDEEQIVKLLELVFNGWPHFDLHCSPLDHWKWKFLDNPLRKNNIALGLVGDWIIACDHGFLTRMKVGNDIILVRQGVDAAVHPGFRGRGIYSNTGKLKDEYDHEFRVGMVYSFTNVKLFKTSRKKSGRPIFPSPVKCFLRISDIDQYVEQLNDSGVLRKIYLKLGLRFMKALNTIQKFFSGPTKHSDSIQLLDVGHFNEEMDAFWDKIKGDYKLITERSREYMNWRYLDPRAGNFVVKAALERGELIGYIVLRINNHDLKGPRGYVLDLCTLKDRLDCASMLIRESSKYFDDNKIGSVEYMIVKGHPYERLFSIFGYVDTRNDNGIYYDLYRDGVKVDDVISFEPGEILFQLGDTDW